MSNYSSSVNISSSCSCDLITWASQQVWQDPFHVFVLAAVVFVLHQVAINVRRSKSEVKRFPRKREDLRR